MDLPLANQSGRVRLVVEMPSGCHSNRSVGSQMGRKPAKSPQGWGFVVLCYRGREVTIGCDRLSWPFVQSHS